MSKIMVSEEEWHQLRALNERVKAMQGVLFFRQNESNLLEIWQPPPPVKQKDD